MKLRLWAFDEEKKNWLHGRPVPKATPFFFSDDTFFSIEAFYTFTLESLSDESQPVLKGRIVTNSGNTDVTSDALLVDLAIAGIHAMLYT